MLVVAFPGVELLDVAGPASVFTTASALVGPKQPGYRVEIAALRTGPLQTRTLETMHRVFKRALGVTPADYRRRFSPPPGASA